MARTLLKTGTYGIMHITVATTLAYILTDSFAVALSIGLLEPLVQTVVFFFHERVWENITTKATTI
jgi:uncharacterized membrane protein